MDAHVWEAGARRRLPVDVPDVVDLGVVRPELGELRATPDQLRPVVAREQALDAPCEVDVERAEQRLREQPGARPRGSRLGDSETLREHQLA
jgi:hypothetical protein